jgi:hypothetical protein
MTGDEKQKSDRVASLSNVYHLSSVVGLLFSDLPAVQKLTPDT